MTSYRNMLVWGSGFLVAIGLMVFDEVLTLARYCGPDCYYEIPVLGGYSQYNAEIFAWLLILAGFSVLLAMTLPVPYQKTKTQQPEGYRGNIRGIVAGHSRAEAEDERPEIEGSA